MGNFLLWFLVAKWGSENFPRIDEHFGGNRQRTWPRQLPLLSLARFHRWHRWSEMPHWHLVGLLYRWLCPWLRCFRPRLLRVRQGLRELEVPSYEECLCPSPPECMVQPGPWRWQFGTWARLEGTDANRLDPAFFHCNSGPFIEIKDMNRLFTQCYRALATPNK